MPPRARITKEMIVDAAFAVAREAGAESINARAVSKRLGCSTQPIMYHFATIEDMKKAAYEKANRFHTEYLMDVDPQKGVMLGIGLNYIRFAVREAKLFRFLFQSGLAGERSLLQMIDAEGLKPILAAMGEEMRRDEAQTKEIFLTLALFAHGYASMLANNSLEFDESVVADHLKRVYSGAVSGSREEAE